MQSNKIHKLILVFILFFSITEIYAVAFRGRLYSRVKSKGEPGLNVLIFETKQAYRTDDDGYFDAEVPTSGVYTFKILRPTGTQELKKGVGVEGEVITIYTDKVDKAKGGIEVEGKKEKTILSRYKVRYDEIKRMPGTLGEALTGLQTLPGVFAPPFGFGQLVIRGANPSWNTYLYDDLPIFYPYHFDTINSVIHNDLIKSIDLYTGAYPANFNNATGGVIEIESTEGVKKASGSSSMSIMLGQAMFQTPLFGGKGYFAAGGKVGYLDKTLGQTSLMPKGVRLPRYTSSNLKFVYNFNDHHQVSFTSLTAQDSFALDVPKLPQNDPTQDPFAAFAGATLSAGRGFSTMGLRYIWTPGDKFMNRVTLIDYHPFQDSNLSFGSIKADFRAMAPYTGVRQDAAWKVFDFLTIDFGSEYRLQSYKVNGYNVRLTDPNNLSPNPYKTTNPDFEKADITQTTKTSVYNGYTTFHFKYKGFSFEPGARYDFVNYSKQGAFGPRAIISYKFDGILKGTTIFGGGGNYFHYPYFDPVLSKQSGNRQIQFEKAIKYSGGVEQQVTDDWIVKTEIFKQEFSNLISGDTTISSMIGPNPDKYQTLTQPYVSNRALSYSNTGTGWSRGIELFIKKTNKPGSRDWFGWVSYTWSQTFRNQNQYSSDYDPNKNIVTGYEARLRSLFHNTKELIYEWDITHLVNFVYGWRINQDWQIGGRWMYRTAYPYTPVTGDDGGQFKNPNNNQTIWSPTYSSSPYSDDYVNSRRMPAYNRMDIRIDKFLNYEWGYMNAYLEIINVYVRQNQNEQNFNSTAPFSKTNPTPQTDFFTLNTGKSIIPFINMGLEVRF